MAQWRQLGLTDHPIGDDKTDWFACSCSRSADAGKANSAKNWAMRAFTARSLID
jgi:hypothetical protein